MFALRIFKLAMNANDTQALHAIIREYAWTKQNPMAHHMKDFWQLLKTSYAMKYSYEDNKTTMEFWKV